MITDALKDEIVGIALTEAEAASGRTLSGSKQSLAGYYAEQAYQDMADSRGGYDPGTHGAGKAKAAAITYVKLRLAGIDPESDARYREARRAWSAAAAREFHANDTIE